ncbi:MAG: class II aldolase/adducin family protein [Verrucomicrobiales bacterium]|jgi:L-fuculose-phosphate aldolase|nr:class II aldolase/adducin family protein [Verrucomicrobiales bacterium]
MNSSLIHPADELVQKMGRIYHYRMTTTSGGNLSILDPDGSIWITPSRVDKGSLRAEDVVRIHADGCVEGAHPPSSEHPFHRKIYQARPDLKAVVHAHPVGLVAFSVCRMLPDTDVFPQSHLVCGRVGMAAYALPGSELLGDNIAAVFARGFNCVLLENHGVVVGGVDLQDAFERFETLEFTAQTLIRANQLGKAARLTVEQLQLAAFTRPPLEKFAPVRATTREKAARRDLARFVRRGYQQRLLVSTEGSFSARVEGEEFVITPNSADRHHIEPGDLALIRGGKSEAGKRPSRAMGLHELIYRAYPGVHAIVNARPVHATAFSAVARRLESRTIPESYIFLREVPKIPFALVYEDQEGVLDYVSPSQPVALLENNGVLILGTGVLDAFDRLEVLEATAEAILEGVKLGPLVEMDEAAIGDLRRFFLKEEI